jgi:formyltetrahydrofolate synthetase
METIAVKVYGADGIELSEAARKKLELYKKQVTHFKMCMVSNRGLNDTSDMLM